MKIPDEVRKCVVFIGRPNHADGLTITSTAFLVGIPGPRVGLTEITFPYLVAAKHTAQKVDGKRFGIHLRRKDGTVLPPQWSAEESRWWYHPTEPEGVDAAVTPWMPWETEYGSEVDAKLVSTANFLTDEAIQTANIGAGDEVFITGLFNRLPAEPIVRSGVVAAIPRDRISGIKIAGAPPVSAESYLVEVRSLGGLSGSPVFVHESIALTQRFEWTRENKEQAMWGIGGFYLMGLMHGHWKILPGEHDRVDFQTTQEEGSIALGLSIVVPAKKILEVLNQDELVEQRRDLVRRLQADQGGTTTD